MGRSRKLTSFSILASIAVVLAAAPLCHAGQVVVTPTPAPDRNGPAENIAANIRCPPQQPSGTKLAPDASLGDKNVAGGPELDYFLGESKFVEGTEDLIVRLWCINVAGSGPPPPYSDYLTYEIIASEGEEEAVAVEPGTPT